MIHSLKNPSTIHLQVNLPIAIIMLTIIAAIITKKQ